MFIFVVGINVYFFNLSLCGEMEADLVLYKLDLSLNKTTAIL